MLIAIEIDNVLYPFDVIVRDWLVDNGFITSDYTVKQAWNFLSKQDDLFKDFIFYSPEIYERRMPDKDTIEQVKKIVKDGNEVVYITSRPKEFRLLTEKWLKSFPGNKSVFFIDDYNEFLKQENVDAFITPKPFYNNGLLVLLTQPFQVSRVYEPRFKSIEKAYLFAKCTFNQLSKEECSKINFYV